MDLTPTILHLMGLPVPDDMDGRVLSEALAVRRPVEYEREMVTEDAVGSGAGGELSAEEIAEVEERLRSLGYLG
jgi:hypothetical protein